MNEQRNETSIKVLILRTLYHVCTVYVSVPPLNQCYNDDLEAIFLFIPTIISLMIPFSFPGRRIKRATDD